LPILLRFYKRKLAPEDNICAVVIMKSNKSKKIFQKVIIVLVALATIFIFDFWLFSPREFFESDLKNEIVESNLSVGLSKVEPTIADYRGFGSASVEKENKKEGMTNKQNEQMTAPEIKSKIDLAVPFTVQAPYAVWDDAHNEACEEAVLIMAKYWVNNRDLTKEAAEQEILDAIQWQEQVFGGHYDLNVSDVVRLGAQYFGFEKIYFTSLKNVSDIKYQLSQGKLVILPTAGRLLNNPYFRQPGPAYHMVVVKGYNNEGIITHDPGTKRGMDFVYSDEVLFQAVHDWPYLLGEKTDLDKDAKAEGVLKGEKIMIVVER